MARDCNEICDALSEPTLAGEGDTVEVLRERDLEAGSHALDEVLNDCRASIKSGQRFRIQLRVREDEPSKSFRRNYVYTYVWDGDRLQRRTSIYM